MAYDLAIHAQTHDLVLTSENGVLMVDNAERVSQQIKITLLLFYGEWFLDVGFGIPYLEQILVKKPNLMNIRSIFMSAIRDVPGVSSVNSLDLYYNRVLRKLTVVYSVSTEYGFITGREVLGYGRNAGI